MPLFLPRINAIGCGNVGKTLLHLWHKQQSAHPGEILNTSIASGIAAIDFIGEGSAISSPDEMKTADLFLIGCPDNSIAQCCETLTHTGLINDSTVVFHCSGALGSSELNSAAKAGASIASAHPVKSFAHYHDSTSTFAGTYCGLEGDEKATKLLRPLFEAIGGNTFLIDSASKTTYHAASVIACNYLVTLQETSLMIFEQSGIDRKLATKLLQPLVEGTVSNIFANGPTAALTGPVARGDHSVVEKQITALLAMNKDQGELYKLMGKMTLELVREKGSVKSDDLKILEKILTH